MNYVTFENAGAVVLFGFLIAIGQWLWGKLVAALGG